MCSFAPETPCFQLWTLASLIYLILSHIAAAIPIAISIDLWIPANPSSCRTKYVGYIDSLNHEGSKDTKKLNKTKVQIFCVIDRCGYDQLQFVFVILIQPLNWRKIGHIVGSHFAYLTTSTTHLPIFYFHDPFENYHLF